MAKTKTTMAGGMTASAFWAGLNNNTGDSNTGFLVASSESTKALADYVCDGTADEVQINQAITAAAALTNGGTVYLTSGLFNIAHAILIKTNVRLVLTDSTKIFLVNNANDYLLRNDDLTSGNSNFSVIGGRWYGNGDNQTYNWTTGDPGVSYFGFGFVFKLCSNFYVGGIGKKMYFEKMSCYCILHNKCTDFIFNEIEFLNIGSMGDNRDGITGSGSINMTISNILAHNTDEIIAFGSSSTFTGIYSGTPCIWTSRNSKNTHIFNIVGKEVGGNQPLGMIGIYATEGTTTEDIYIDNITGGSYNVLHFIRCHNYSPTAGKGYMKNINISNIDVKLVSAQQGILRVYNPYSELEIDMISISNVRFVNQVDVQQVLFILRSAVKKFYLNGITGKNTVGVNQHQLLSVDATVQANTICIHGVDLTSDVQPYIVNQETPSISLRIHAPDCFPYNLAQVNGALIGDMCRKVTTNQPLIYTTKWINVITGADA